MSLSDSLERPAYRELEVVRRLMNGERRTGDGTRETLIDSCRIECKIDAEWRVENRHHNLEFDTSAHAQAGVGSRQKLRRDDLDQAGRNDSPFQFLRLQHPGVSGVQKRNQ